jgi:TatA/E family protein of Tat protein translocase
VFGISGTELVLIAAFAFIIFGPDKIPEIARTVGKAVAMFKRVQEDTEKLIKAEMFSLEPDSAARAEAAETVGMASSLYAAEDDLEGEEEE